MPRPFLTNRCQPCRSRKIRCDGNRPSCLRCQGASRNCHWAGEVHPPQSTRPSQHITSREPSSTIEVGPISIPSCTEYVSTKDPVKALQDPLAARLFRYYIDHLAGWYDLNDSKRYFGDIVPVCARKNPLLLSAMLAFAAASQSSSTGDSLADLAETYHLESVQTLLSLTKSLDEFRTGETLAAICLLRSYEIISQNVTCQNHLQGSYSLLSSHPAGIETGLLSAGFWNYLREDITVALVDKRSLMIELSHQNLPLRIEGDDDFANRVTYLLGKVINCCLQQDVGPLDRSRWEFLKSELESWKSSLPPSFEPISTKGLDPESKFPCLWTTSGWHAAGLQYYHAAMIILWLAEPLPQAVNVLQQIERISDEGRRKQTSIPHHSRLCLSNFQSLGTSMGQLFSTHFFLLGGPWLREPQRLIEVVGEMEKWGKKTGWPVDNIVSSLLKSSNVGPRSES